MSQPEQSALDSDERAVADLLIESRSHGLWASVEACAAESPYFAGAVTADAQAVVALLRERWHVAAEGERAEAADPEAKREADGWLTTVLVDCQAITAPTDSTAADLLAWAGLSEHTHVLWRAQVVQGGAQPLASDAPLTLRRGEAYLSARRSTTQA